MAIQPLVIYGRVVTMDAENALLGDGAVYIGADELIHAVQGRGDPAPAGFASACRVETSAVSTRG